VVPLPQGGTDVTASDFRSELKALWVCYAAFFLALEGEFCALNVGDVNRQTGAVMIRRPKNRRDRVTRFGARARLAVVKYLAERGKLAPDQPLWVLKTPAHELAGECMSVNTTKMLLAACRRAPPLREAKS
jgi:hypothetical protein